MRCLDQGHLHIQIIEDKMVWNVVLRGKNEQPVCDDLAINKQAGFPGLF